MSIIKSIKQVLGLSSTASENHFWDGSVPNQLSLKRGTPEAPGADVFAVVNGKVAVLPMAQVWRNYNVPAQRATNTNYTNNTGAPLTVTVRGTNAVASGFMDLRINVGALTIVKSVISTSVGGEEVWGTAVVPVGETYSVNFTGDNTPSLTQWAELS